MSLSPMGRSGEGWCTDWRPMQMLEPFLPSVCLEHPEHCENGERYGKPIGSRTPATYGTHLQPHTTTPFPIGRFVRFPYLLIITSIIKAVLVVLCLSVLCVQDLESEMTSQRTVLESLNVTGRQMSRGGSSSNTGDSGGDGGGALLAQLEDMNQRSSSLATRAAEIRSECAGIWWWYNIIVQSMMSWHWTQSNRYFGISLTR